jgi:hypothetical protein
MPMNAVIALSYLLGRTGLDGEQAAFLDKNDLCALDRFTAIGSQLRLKLGPEAYDLALHHMNNLQFSEAINLLEATHRATVTPTGAG